MIFETLIIAAVVIVLALIFFLLIIKNNKIKEKIKIFKLKMLLMSRNIPEAKKLALKLADKYPQNYFVHKILGKIYEDEGKINVALDEYIKAVEINQEDYELQYKVATLFQKSEKNEEAIIMLQDLLKVKPDYIKATLLLGNILYDEERFKEAVSVYTAALRYNITEYELYYNLGMTFTRLNDFQKAREYYLRAAKLNSYLYNGQYNLALIAMIQGELDEAERRLQRAMQQEELEPTVYFYLAQIALLKEDKEKALNYINLALELDENIKEKIEKQPLFAIIQNRIKVPKGTRKIEIKLTEKEIKTNKYLEEMYSLVDSLNNNDALGNTTSSKEKKKDNPEKENEKER